MNVEFEAALQYINMENYDRAVEYLNKAIDKEMDEDREDKAIEYRCVLGELLANLDRRDEARDEFAAVVDYCDFSNRLPNQKTIASAFIKAIDEGGPLPSLDAGSPAHLKRDPSVPLIPKPVQNKSFISKQMNKRK
ncbi:MAG: tetratricopeptide repeat protein [Oscillospiraceae bacterium]|nr:tetratricopeptide repeat protein [Oscillospiraceae bacterium]